MLSTKWRYIHGALGVHCVKRAIKKTEYSLSFYQTTSSEREISTQSYEIGSLPQAKITIAERNVREAERKQLKSTETEKKGGKRC